MVLNGVLVVVLLLLDDDDGCYGNNSSFNELVLHPSLLLSAIIEG